uniref:Uncharacterized protein n=1 Tax=Haptolina brevifila TaxID=156173 RepID=A0A7S2HNG3_9EUKA
MSEGITLRTLIGLSIVVATSIGLAVSDPKKWQASESDDEDQKKRSATHSWLSSIICFGIALVLIGGDAAFHGPPNVIANTLAKSDSAAASLVLPPPHLRTEHHTMKTSTRAPRSHHQHHLMTRDSAMRNTSKHHHQTRDSAMWNTSRFDARRPAGTRARSAFPH